MLVSRSATSADHKPPLIATGDLSVLIGDGQLNYRRESVLETYYAFALNKWFTLTADYQFIANPAYNADRGPVHVFSGRLHGRILRSPRWRRSLLLLPLQKEAGCPL